MRVLVTGAAGFIGFHVSQKLCEQGIDVIGLDNINAYYQVSLKNDRLKQLERFDNFTFVKQDIVDHQALLELFERNRFDHVIHLAAQAGVRYSLDNPFAYSHSNLTGHLSVLEACRHYPVKHLVYASSSSVYGNYSEVPYCTNARVDNPVSLYAATKKSNELMASTYAHLYQIPATGLRFFTVYGPWGRPDMALFKFTDAIYNAKPIDIFNHGKLSRDFTFIDDIVDGVLAVLALPPIGEQLHHVHNIGNGQPVKLEDFVSSIEKHTGITAIKHYVDMQPGDVYETYADTSALIEKTGLRPKVDIDEGIAKFVQWYKDYYQM